MRLERFGYSEHDHTPDEWLLKPFGLQKVNLIVARNASGKSRALSVIRSLARAINGKFKVRAGRWHAEFANGNDRLVYHLANRDGVIMEEEFKRNGEVLLSRDSSGIGKIQAVEAKTSLSFQVPQDELAIFGKRDLIQHPFLEPIHAWAESLRFYPFGTPLGRQSIAIFVEKGPKPDLTDPDQIVAVFREGEKNFTAEFKPRVIRYMKRIGYDLEDLQIGPLPDISIEGPLPNLTATGLNVKERDLPCWTYQTEASQGMFRALSILVQIAYSELAAKPSAILIDDIGEGLDYERSTDLIKLLMDRAEHNDFQLILSTNDRFVMNAVPLEYWAVLVRHGAVCRIVNYENSKARFDQFRFTGLSNFDFFTSDFVEQESTAHEEAGDLR